MVLIRGTNRSPFSPSILVPTVTFVNQSDPETTEYSYLLITLKKQQCLRKGTMQTSLYQPHYNKNKDYFTLLLTIIFENLKDIPCGILTDTFSLVMNQTIIPNGFDSLHPNKFSNFKNKEKIKIWTLAFLTSKICYILFSVLGAWYIKYVCFGGDRGSEKSVTTMLYKKDMNSGKRVLRNGFNRRTVMTFHNLWYNYGPAISIVLGSVHQSPLTFSFVH